MLNMEKNIESKMEKKNTGRIDKDIIGDIREYLGVDRNDISKDDIIDNMPLNKIFHNWCEWNGLINHSRELRRVVGSIYGIDIERRVVLK